MYVEQSLVMSYRYSLAPILLSHMRQGMFMQIWVDIFAQLMPTNVTRLGTGNNHRCGVVTFDCCTA